MYQRIRTHWVVNSALYSYKDSFNTINKSMGMHDGRSQTDSYYTRIKPTAMGIQGAHIQDAHIQDAHVQDAHVSHNPTRSVGWSRDDNCDLDISQLLFRMSHRCISDLL